MFGGEFDYLSCKIEYIANEIEEIIERKEFIKAIKLGSLIALQEDSEDEH